MRNFFAGSTCAQRWCGSWPPGLASWMVLTRGWVMVVFARTASSRMWESPVVERMRAARQTGATRSFHQLILATLTIVAILLGLVGMHALSSGSAVQDGHASDSAMSSVHHLAVAGSQVEAAASTPPPLLASVSSVGHGIIDGCTGMCEMNCLLLGMVCALSLLFAAAGLFLRRMASPPMTTIRRIQRALRIRAFVFVLPAAPSLNVLSVSRV